MEIGLAHRWANKTLSSREMEKGGIEMPERTSAIPAWAWIVGAVLVIVSIFAGYRAVQTQQHLAATQSELENAKQAAEKANAERNELETKLDGATSEVRSAQSVLAETQSVLEAAQSELERATQEAEKGSAQRAEIQNKLDEAVSETKSVQSRLAETQSRLEAAQSELESAKQQAEQAKAQVAELEQKGANLKLELQKGTASVLSSRQNWMRPDRRLSG
jgi:chromosome segregation ATPase